MRKKLVSLFTGAGLMDLGFELAGWEVIAAVEIDKQAVQTWQHNRPDHADRILCADILKVTAGTLGLGPGELDLVIGGPPCQGFSVANSQRVHKNGNTSAWKDDPKNLFYLEYKRLVEELRPRMFVMENVKAMYSTGAAESGKPGPIILEVLTDFTEAGYRCQAEVLDTADYGVPQHRERVFVIGVRADLTSPILYPIQTHGDRGSGFPFWRTVRQAIGDLPDPADNIGRDTALRRMEGQLFHPGPMNHDTFAPLGELRYDQGKRQLKPDQPSPTVPAHHNTDVPIHPGPMNHEQPTAPRPGIKPEWLASDGNAHLMEWDKPSHTVAASQESGDKNLVPVLNHNPTHNDGKTTLEALEEYGMVDRPAGSLTADPRLSRPGNHHGNIPRIVPRRLTPRECARLQSVPDWYFFCGSKSSTYRQIGNGVPVEMARRLGAVLIGTEPGRQVAPHQPQLTLF